MQEININSLANKIEIHFDLSEIRGLCFELKDVDFENLEGRKKADKARELVLFMKRRDRIDELVNIVSKKRPRVIFSEPLTIPNVTKALPEEQKKELSFLFDEWAATNQELINWKTLHNHLDILLNSVFDLFDTKVKSLHNDKLKGTMLQELKETWMNVEIRLVLLFREAANIHSNNQSLNGLGNIYQNPFKKLDTLCKEINLHLDQLELGSVNRFWSRGDISIVLPAKFKNWIVWWWHFAELNRQLKKEIKTNMTLTDDQLRETAERLSKQTERIRGEQK